VNLESYRMYLIAVRGGMSDEKSRDLQRFVRYHDGFILMVTRTGPIIALDEAKSTLVSNHPLVEFMGPVELNPRGFAARQLESIFAANLGKQVELIQSDSAPTS
jgi:hypothetical protein